MSRTKHRRSRLWTLMAACSAATILSGAAVPGGAVASPSVLAQAPARASDTTIDEKYAAAAVLGWVPREEVTLADRDFVTVLWEKASEKHNVEVKAAALAAFNDPADAAAASATFIRTGIFAANDRDAARKARKAELDTIRLRAAQEINWVPANNTERTTMLDQTLQNYLLALWRKAATWPEVKAAAEPLTVAGVTDDQRLDFLRNGLFDKAETDRQNEIAEGNAEEVAAREAAALRSAKEKAIATALKRSATGYELDDLELRELIYLLASESTGRKVKAAATVAYADPDEAVWRAYVFAGVHLANKVDLDERDLADARANEVKVRDIMYAAEADGYKPVVQTAAKKALEGPALDRSLFLLSGHETARQADFVRPSANRVVMIQANGYNGCLAEPVPFVTDAWHTELDARVEPCNENSVSQRWTLVPDATTGRYKLVVDNESVCLFPKSSQLSQDGAPISARRCSEATGAAVVWELLDNGQGQVEIRNVTNNKVITAVAGGPAGSLNIVQNPNGHLAAQQWRLIDPVHQGAVSMPPTGSFRIKGVQSGRCIGYGKPPTSPSLELHDCSTAAEQIWDVTTLPDNRFELRSRGIVGCLRATAYTVANSYADLYECGKRHGTALSVMFNKSGGGWIRNASTGGYLTAMNGGTAHGTWVAVEDYVATTDQQWIFEPVSEGATQPVQVWTTSGKPLTSFSGTAITYQPACTVTNWATYFSAPGSGFYWRAEAANAKRGLVRADRDHAASTTDAHFQYCVVGAPTSTKMEVTLRNTALNAYVREATNVSPSGLLIADQTSAAGAQRFILQQRRAQVSGNSVIQVLQSQATRKYAVIDTTATGTNAKAVRFMADTPTGATELSMQTIS